MREGAAIQYGGFVGYRDVESVTETNIGLFPCIDVATEYGVILNFRGAHREVAGHGIHEIIIVMVEGKNNIGQAYH